MYDASNRKDIRKAEKDAKLSETMRLDYLKAAMSTMQGRAWYYDFLENCHCFNDPFTGNPLTEAYRKGERNVGLRVFSDIITHCPDEYLLMVREENGRRIERDINRDTAVDEQRSGENAGWDTEGPVDIDVDLYSGAEEG